MRRAGRVPSLQPAAAGVGEWFPRRPYRATCRRIELPGPEQLAQHPSPVPDCTCGIYASSSLRTLVTSTPSMPAVSAVGTVALWGRVMEHERGWRAEFAYPDRLTLVCVICLQEGSGAGEPAFVVAEPVLTGPYPAVAVCRDHVAAVSVGPRVMAPAAVIRSALLDRYAVDLMPFDSVRSLFERDPVLVPFARPGRPTPPTPLPARQVPTRQVPTHVPLVPPAVPGGGAPAGGSPQPATSRPPRPSLGRRVARGIGQVVTFILQAALFLLMCAWGIGSCVMTMLPSDAATSPPPVVVPEPEVTDPSTLAVVRQPPDRDAPVPTDIEVVCGLPHGGWVELVSCKRSWTLLGWATSPPDHSCMVGDIAMTRRWNYSICWHAFDGPVDLVRHPAAADPFEGKR